MLFYIILYYLNMGYEDYRQFTTETGGILKVFESPHLPARWSQGRGVFAEVIQKGEEFWVQAGIEDGGDLADKDLKNNALPTSLVFKDEATAIKVAQELFDDRENWPEEKYNQ